MITEIITMKYGNNNDIISRMIMELQTTTTSNENNNINVKLWKASESSVPRDRFRCTGSCFLTLNSFISILL